jgi:ATP-dependent DNA helicase Rep
LGEGVPIQVLTGKNEEQEASKVITQLLNHKFQHNTPFRDYAILYRSNHQSRIFERTLREQHIPYQLSGGTSFFARTETKDILAYCKLLVNEDDDSAFLRVVNTPKRELGPATLEKLGTYAKQRNLSLYAASFELGLEYHLTGKPLERLREFVTWIARMKENIANTKEPVPELHTLIKDIGYYEWLLETSPSPQTAERRMENVHDLLNWLTRLLDPINGKVSTLTGALHHMLLVDMLDRQSENTPSDTVQLMTLHAAKGLEFPHVFLIGMEEGLLPHKNSIAAGDITEERRLAYVGITRAQHSLTFSLCQQRRNYQEIIDVTPSRFLDELPKADLDWDTQQQPLTQTERDTNARSHCAALRELLAQKRDV